MTTYRVLPEYTDDHLTLRAADTDYEPYRAACLALLTVPADWRWSIFSAATMASLRTVAVEGRSSSIRALMSVSTGVDMHDETARLVAEFHAGWRPPRREKPVGAEQG